MNVVDGLKTIRDRLLTNGAQDATLDHVEQILKRASLPSAGSAAAQSLLQLTRMLMRHPTAATNSAVYNDLALLEEQFERAAQTAQQRAAEEAAKPMPKTHKYYKDLKEKKAKSES